MVGQDDNCIGCERMARARVTKGRTQRFSVLRQQALPAIREIDRKEIASARNKVATIIRHQHNTRCSALMGFASLYYTKSSLRSSLSPPEPEAARSSRSW